MSTYKNATDLCDFLPDDLMLFHGKRGKAVPMPLSDIPVADTHGHLHCLRELTSSAALARAALAGVGMLVDPIDPVEDIPFGIYSAPTVDAWRARTLDEAHALLEYAKQKGVVLPYFSQAHIYGYERPAYNRLLDSFRIIAGVHPYGAAQFDASARERLMQLLNLPYCVGIGEIGLDFGPYNKVAPNDQIHALEFQLRLAHERNLPVELHIRDAQDDNTAAAHVQAVQVLRNIGVPPRGCVLHCFTSTPQVMKPFVEMGCTIAFGGVSTFASAPYVRQAIQACPLNQMVTETDAPYMAPVPMRGHACEIAHVVFTAASLVATKCAGSFDSKEATCIPPNEPHAVSSISQSEVYGALWNNAYELFMKEI